MTNEHAPQSANKPEKSSNRLARDAYRALVRRAKDAERDGHDVRPGSTMFWTIFSEQSEMVSQIMETIHEEIAHEVQAMGSVDEERHCLECDTPLVKKFKRGRWPIYCDDCR